MTKKSVSELIINFELVEQNKTICECYKCNNEDNSKTISSLLYLNKQRTKVIRVFKCMKCDYETIVYKIRDKEIINDMLNELSYEGN